MNLFFRWVAPLPVWFSKFGTHGTNSLHYRSQCGFPNWFALRPANRSQECWFFPWFVAQGSRLSGRRRFDDCPGVGRMLLDLPVLILGDAQQELGDWLKIAGKFAAIDVEQMNIFIQQAKHNNFRCTIR